MRIALSAKRLSGYIRVQKGNSYTIEALAKVFFGGSTKLVLSEVEGRAHHERKN